MMGAVFRYLANFTFSMRWAKKASRARRCIGQLRGHSISPLGSIDLATVVLTYLPTGIDQRDIDGLKCPLLSGCNEADNLGKARFLRYASFG
jgi:hypothetical protein